MMRPHRSIVAGAVILLVAGGAFAAPAADAALLERARQILRRVPLVDGHNDLPWQYRERVRNRVAELDIARDQSALRPSLHTDIPRLREGGVGAQFWSVYVPATLDEPAAVVQTLEQIDVVHRLNEAYPDTFELALTAEDVRRIHGQGKIASLIGVEGGHSIAGSLAVLRQLYALGARYMTLTHSNRVAWADSATDAPRHGGLTRFGVEVVREMNRLGMLVDLSHVSAEAMNDALDAAAAPVIFSHSSARALNAHPRNVPDPVLRRLPENGGVVMVTFVPSFVSEEIRQWSAARQAERARLDALHSGDPARAATDLEQWRARNPPPEATVSQVADHIDHVRAVAGIDHIGIGSDFDGISSTPTGLSDVSDFPYLFAELLRRGYSEQDVAKIAGLNVLRVMDRVEAVSRELAAARPPSDELLDALDAAPSAASSVEGPAGKIHVVQAGAGGAVPVVLVHGNGSDHRTWREQIAHLRSSRRVVAYDLRGMGKSDPDREGDYSIPAMVDDLEAVVDHLGLDRFVLAAHSYGGAVAAAYAGRHPHRVAGIVFADSAGNMSRVPPDQAAKFLSNFAPETYEPFVERYFTQILAGSREETRDLVLSSVRATPRQAFVNALADLWTFDPVARLSRYDGPMISVAVERFDGPFALHRQIADMPVRMMTGVSHWLMLDDPATFNRHLDEFLAEIDLREPAS